VRKISAITALIISSVVAITPAANAETSDFPCGGNATYSVLMPQGVLLDGKKCVGELTIDPRVKIIDLTAFNNANITSVVIPNSVTSIGDYAFAGSQLSRITIPNSVISLGTGAFQRTQLSSIEIPNSLTTISSGLFSSTKITNVVIPKSVTSIEGSAFAGTPLTSITIPNSVIRIGNSAFASTQLSYVTIPNSVTSIGAEAFAGNLSLITISIPEGLSYLGEKAFDRTYSLNSIAYCGTITGFPITPTCTADKAAEGNAAKGNAASEVNSRIVKAKSSFMALISEIDLLMRKYPSQKSNLILYKNKAALFETIDERNLATAEVNLLGITSKIISISSTYKKIAISINCSKGKRMLKVIDVKPVCPAGYKVKK